MCDGDYMENGEVFFCELDCFMIFFDQLEKYFCFKELLVFTINFQLNY